MNRNLAYTTLILLAVIFTGCEKLPINKKVTVAKSPSSKLYIEADSMQLKDGNPQKKLRWIVFSDRDNNSTQVSISNDMPEKKLAFLEPLYVIKNKGSFVKVTAFNPSLNLKATKGKLEKKSLKYTGWIAKEKLLLWTGALKDRQTSFITKAVTNVANADMMIKAEKYFSGDSLLLYNAPDLLKPLPKKIVIGRLVYIYKRSDDRKSYLIGADPFVTTDSIAQSMLGWISVNAVTIWGTRPGITLKPEPADTATGLFATAAHAAAVDTAPVLPRSRQEDRTVFENIFPVHANTADSVIKAAYLENILDYSKNKVFNVLGKPIFYNKYREIVRSANRLNVVFVIDGGATNRLYLPSVKSVLQDLQLYFDTTTSFRSTKFGSVIYKRTQCDSDSISDVQSLTSSYTDIIKFIDDKQKHNNCGDENIYQPVHKGIIDACNLLSAVKNETNIIVIVGTTGSDNANISDVISSVSRVQARLMFFQTISKSADAYNDFVLAAEKIVVESSQNISELKKEKLVDQNDVITNLAYSLQVGDSGIYYLDYPAKSMTEGFVLYPKKGEVMLPGILKKNFDSLLHQIILDNRKVIQSLHTYFKSNIGVNNTDVRKEFAGYMPNAPSPIPVNFASSFINIDNGFLIPGFAKGGIDTTPANTVKYGVLLTEAEFDKQAYYFDQIFNTSGAKGRFDKKEGIYRYMLFLKKYASEHSTKLSRGKMKKMTPAAALKFFTGFVTTDSLSNSLTLKQLRKKKSITNKRMIEFFNGFKYAANAMREKKNEPYVRINCKGTYYYWVDEKLMP